MIFLQTQKSEAATAILKSDVLRDSLPAAESDHFRDGYEAADRQISARMTPAQRREVVARYVGDTIDDVRTNLQVVDVGKSAKVVFSRRLNSVWLHVDGGTLIGGSGSSGEREFSTTKDAVVWYYERLQRHATHPIDRSRWRDVGTWPEDLTIVDPNRHETLEWYARRRKAKDPFDRTAFREDDVKIAQWKRELELSKDMTFEDVSNVWGFEGLFFSTKIAHAQKRKMYASEGDPRTVEANRRLAQRDIEDFREALVKRRGEEIGRTLMESLTKRTPSNELGRFRVKFAGVQCLDSTGELARRFQKSAGQMILWAECKALGTP